MASHGGDAIRQVNRLFQVGAVGILTDGQLLERFSTRRGETAEAAFEALVARHGPMVARVCRGLLRDPHDADDAFQATFLVLVKKAHAIGERELLGPWLYGVAYRVSLKARSLAAKRRKREGTFDLEDPPSDTAAAIAPWNDLRPILHEELARLPEKYRKPVVLCHLQGLTHQEAAQELAWPVGTVSVRLARARKLLKDRLTRRGLTTTATLWGAGLMGDAALGAVPLSLIRSTVLAAVSLTTRQTLTAGTVSAGVALLSKRTIATMTISRWTWVALPLVLAVGALGGVVGTQQVLIQKMERQARAQAEALAQASTPAPSPTTTTTEVAQPPPPNSRSPFDVGEMPGAAQPPVGVANQLDEDMPQYKVLPPLVSRGSSFDLDPPPGYFDLPAPNKQDGTDPPLIKPGQILRVEVLEALPGRPISGERVVRPDGTISLGFYGDLRVAGLNRLQIKVKLIELLRKTLTDEVLGLGIHSKETDTIEAVPPVESGRVFIDESSNYYPTDQPRPQTVVSTLSGPHTFFPKSEATTANPADTERIGKLEAEIEALKADLEKLRAKPTPAKPPETPPTATPG